MKRTIATSERKPTFYVVIFLGVRRQNEREI